MLRGILRFTLGILLFGSGMSVHADPSYQDKQCMDRGWQRIVLQVAGLSREVLWKAPSGPWAKGAIIVMHGGGGEHFQWCVANARVIKPQVNFSEMALADGFAVFLLNSSDKVTDNESRMCGKVWDDEVRDRPNLDLPFIETVIRTKMPELRPEGSQTAIFVTGLSSGGYMTVRAATHFGDLIAGFAPVSSGDPYGWHRICERGLTLCFSVHGAGYDNETGKHITERDSCRADAYPREKTWDSSVTGAKPPFLLLHHEMDGINDVSCVEKVGRLLRHHGYPGPDDFMLQGGRRGLANHLWQDDYNRPILDFFSGLVAGGRK